MPNPLRNANDCLFRKNVKCVILCDAKEAIIMLNKIAARVINSAAMVSLALIYAMDEIY